MIAYFLFLYLALLNLQYIIIITAYNMFRRSFVGAYRFCFEIFNLVYALRSTDKVVSLNSSHNKTSEGFLQRLSQVYSEIGEW